MEPSPLQRLVALRGTTARAAEAAIALWSAGDRALLVRLGLIDHAQDFSLTAAGRRVLNVSA